MGHIDGVQVGALRPHADERGSFTEVYASHWGTEVDPTQWSVVRSEPGALRGMHLHRRHDEYLTVVDGILWVGLHDLRPGSLTEGAAMLIRLDGATPQYLAFPRGLVHGWIAETPVLHLQAVSESYVSYGADDNGGCRWDDPELGVDWPIRPTSISERSAAFGSLSDLRAAVAGPAGRPATAALDAAAP